MLKMIRFFLGQGQTLPRWADNLPQFIFPVCVGDNTFKWFGITLHTRDARGGETYFMAMRRK